MNIRDSISIPQANRSAQLELLLGDLSEIPLVHEVDILVISAFPNDYSSLPGSLMLALKEKGLSVQDLAIDKAVDLRDSLGCWLSHPLTPELQEKLHFRQLLCFEPGTHASNPVEVVGNIFRCLNNFAFKDTNNSIAMPVIGSGYQQVPFERMFPALVDTSLFWLEHGLPLDSIKIVVHDQKKLELSERIFQERKLERQSTTGSDSISENPDPNFPGTFTMAEPEGLDYFISYAHTQIEQVQHFIDILQKRNPVLKIFYDKSSIPAGGLWIRQISDAIGAAKKVIIFMSPDYSASMICWDEFQCAKLKEYNSKSSVIQTIYLNNDPTLPVIMAIHSYIDCREGDLVKLAAACEQLLQ